MMNSDGLDLRHEQLHIVVSEHVCYLIQPGELQHVECADRQWSALRRNAWLDAE